MSQARLIDGSGIARQLRAEVAARAADLAATGHLPSLAVILVGSDPASQIYVKHKVKACQEAGIRSLLETCAEDLSESDLLARIATLNADPSVHGILVQMPLPKHISAARVIEAISPLKDVDGYSVESAGRLVAGLPGFRPCTPWGCMRLIESTGIEAALASNELVSRHSYVCCAAAGFGRDLGDRGSVIRRQSQDISVGRLRRGCRR